MTRWTPYLLTVITVLLLAAWLASGRWAICWTNIERDNSSAMAVGIGQGRLLFVGGSDPSRVGGDESGWAVVTRRGYGLNWGFPGTMTVGFWALPLWIPVVVLGAAAGAAWRRRLRGPRDRARPLERAGLLRRAFERVTVLLLAVWLVSAWWSAAWYPAFSGGWRGVFGFAHGRIGLGVTGRPARSTIEYLGFELGWWFDWVVDTTYVQTERILVVPIWTVVLFTGGAAVLLRVKQMRRAPRLGACPRCGYDLAGLPLPESEANSPTCPECGA